MSNVKWSPEEKERERLDTEARVRIQVLTLLGRPPGLHRVQVIYLYGSAYRVNVFVDGENHRQIADSFFIHFLDDVGITSCEPPIRRKYE